MYFVLNDLLITPNYILPIKSITTENNLYTIMLEITKNKMHMFKNFCGKYEPRIINIKYLDIPNTLHITNEKKCIIGFKIKSIYIKRLPLNYKELVIDIKKYFLGGLNNEI